MTRYHLTLLRHAESQGNVENLVQGHIDMPLTARGREQASHLTSFWQQQNVSFDLIISSPLVRAHQTAEIIAAGLGAPLELDPIWEERYFGKLEGIPFDEVRQSIPEVDFFHPYYPVGEDGETHMDLYLRAVKAIQSLLHRHAGRYLVVSHGAMLNTILYAIIGITPQGHYHSPRFRFDNACFADLTYNPERRQWLFLSLNNHANRDETT